MQFCFLNFVSVFIFITCVTLKRHFLQNDPSASGFPTHCSPLCCCVISDSRCHEQGYGRHRRGRPSQLGQVILDTACWRGISVLNSLCNLAQFLWDFSSKTAKTCSHISVCVCFFFLRICLFVYFLNFWEDIYTWLILTNGVLGHWGSYEQRSEGQSLFMSSTWLHPSTDQNLFVF